MKALVEFAMAGRRQAILAAMLLGILPLVNSLSAPIVALVCLRHGPKEALTVGVWAMLPALAWAVAGDVLPLLLLVGTTVLAEVLRSSRSWEMALLSAIGVGIGGQLALTLQPGFLELMQQQLEQMMARPEFEGQVGLLPPEQLQQMLAMFFGLLVMSLSLVFLMLARSWQARLYNPGGFRQEFHSLRLGWKTAALLLVLFMLGTLVAQLQTVVMYLVIPLIFAGIALVHGIVGLRRWPVAVLVIFYASLLSPVMTQLLVLAAVIDSWYDFRSRMRRD